MKKLPVSDIWCVGTGHNVGKWEGISWMDRGNIGGWTLLTLAFDPQGTMWGVGTQNNVGKWNGTGWETPLLLKNSWPVLDLTFDKQGTMWCVGTGHNVGKWNGHSWENQDSHNPKGSNFDDWMLLSLTFDDPQGNVWCVGTQHNVGKFNMGSQRWDDQGLLGGWELLSLTFDKQGNMWCVGTDNNIGKWNGNGWEQPPLMEKWKLLDLAFA